MSREMIASQKAKELAQRQHDQCKAEVEFFRAWTAQQKALGRPVRELTWGNCIRETGAWRAAADDAA